MQRCSRNLYGNCSSGVYAAVIAEWISATTAPLVSDEPVVRQRRAGTAPASNRITLHPCHHRRDLGKTILMGQTRASSIR